MNELPVEWQAAVRAAEQAFRTLQQRLQERLTAEIASTGAAGAVSVCRDEAQKMTEQVEKESGFAIGRTSDRLRNPKNAPRSWAREYVAAHAGKPAPEVPPVWFDLGERIGVLRPIPTGGVCLVCHGEPRGFDVQLRETLGRLYPEDRAVGFRSGELRGFFWAEVPKRALEQPATPRVEGE